MKDVGEEVAVMDVARDLPEDVRAHPGRRRPPDVKALALHTDVFDGVLRHLAAILPRRRRARRGDFWAEVGRACGSTRGTSRSSPTRWRRTTSSGRSSGTSCLNRLQLRNTLEMVDLSDQAESLIYAGTLDNPIA